MTNDITLRNALGLPDGVTNDRALVALTEYVERFAADVYRESKVLSAENVAHLKKLQAHLLQSHGHITNSLALTAKLLDAAGKNDVAAVTVTGPHGRADRKALAVQLAHVRALRTLKRGI